MTIFNDMRTHVGARRLSALLGIPASGFGAVWGPCSTLLMEIGAVLTTRLEKFSTVHRVEVPGRWYIELILTDGEEPAVFESRSDPRDDLLDLLLTSSEIPEGGTRLSPMVRVSFFGVDEAADPPRRYSGQALLDLERGRVAEVTRFLDRGPRS